jgi:hypothetical protein
MDQVLKQCGDNLTRENVMKQAASLNKLELGALLPGISINTSVIDFAPIKQLQLEKFQGDTWHRFGDVLAASLAADNWVTAPQGPPPFLSVNRVGIVALDEGTI